MPSPLRLPPPGSIEESSVRFIVRTAASSRLLISISRTSPAGDRLQSCSRATRRPGLLPTSPSCGKCSTAA